MNIQPRLHRIARSLRTTLISLLLSILVISLNPNNALAADTNGRGAVLFEQHCAACHIHGGNIIRRGRTLRMNALEKRGIASPDAIAVIAREGIGQMSGYEEVLGSGGDVAVADWIWEQAQNAWIQG